MSEFLNSFHLVMSLQLETEFNVEISRPYNQKKTVNIKQQSSKLLCHSNKPKAFESEMIIICAVQSSLLFYSSVWTLEPSKDIRNRPRETHIRT